LALQLLERYGVVTREMVLAEGVLGGFAAVYPIFKELEERGQVRRGYFVTGQGAAQFALLGAVDRLRSYREVEDPVAPVVLAATDPAQPFGAALSWPTSAGRPTRTAGAMMVLADGQPLVWVDRGSHHLVTFEAALSDTRWIGALSARVTNGVWPSLEIRKVDGGSVRDHAVAALLTNAGFKDAYKGLVIRRT
jgi:ATP-dependent helicase Lhr and Lhr-like helicase